MNDEADDMEYESPLTAYPEAHQEVFDTARTEAEAATIFQRHGIDEVSAQMFAQMTFADGREHLKALLPEAQAA